MTESRILVLGAGGHASVVLDVLKELGLTASGCIAPSAPAPGWPQEVPWLGDDACLNELAIKGSRLVNGVGSGENNSLRSEVFKRAAALGFEFLSVRHPASIIASNATVGEGGQVMAGAILQTGAQLGANVLINSGAIVEHHANISDHVHIAPGAVLSGNVSIGEGAHVGAGAVVRQGSRVGAGAIVGAGAVVVSDVPSGACYVGNPARALR